MKLTAADVLLMHPTKRARVLDWVREQGLEPDEVRSFRTVGPLIRVVGPLIRVEVFVTDKYGCTRLDPDDSARPWTRTRWIRRRTRFPELATIGDAT